MKFNNILGLFPTKGNCGKRKKTRIKEVVGKTAPVWEVCLIGGGGDGGEQMTSSRGPSSGWPKRLAKYSNTPGSPWYGLVMLGFQKFPFALVMDCGGTEWAIG